MHIHYLAEREDLDMGSDTFHGFREECEAKARKWSKEGDFLAYVVALDGGVRVGHKVFVEGHVDRVEGTYE